jgi:hypothetical protein
MKVVGLSSAFAVGLAAVAVASQVPPIHYGDAEDEENNPSCAFFNPDWNELKIDQAPTGEYKDVGGADNPGGDGPLVFTITSSDGKTFDWESNIPVDAVIVKGGNKGSNVYMYGANEAESDTGLHSPDNSQGKRPAISHISACYDTSAQQQEQEQLQEEEPQQLEQEQQEEQSQQESSSAESTKAEPQVSGDGEGEENNPSCASMNAGWNELKINEAPNGEFRDEGGTDNPGGDGPLVFTVKRSDGKVFDWESNIGVDAIVVKGGNNGSNVYTYDPEEILDSGLQSPLNSQGNVPAVSHISVCYDAESAAQQEQEEETQGEEQPPPEEEPEQQAEEQGSAVDPAEYGDGEGEENNPSCASMNAGWNELKINGAPNGEYKDVGGTDNPGGDGALVFTIKNSDGKVFDWESNIGVDAIVVKGGNNGSNVYFYDPEALSDSGLRSPDNTQGNVHEVSHISVCYDEEEEQPEDEGGQGQGENERPAEPGDPEDQAEDQPDEEDTGDRTEHGGTNERQADDPQDDSTDAPAEEDEGSDDQPEEDEGESDVEGISETDDGADDDIAEETSPFSDDDSGSGGSLPFTGAPLGALLLIGLVLTLVGAALRAGQRTKAS